MSDPERDIDWSLTTWEGSRRAQLRRALTLTLRERLEAVQGLADVMRRFEEMRARGEFTYAGRGSSQAAAAPGAREPSPPHDQDCG